MSDILRTRKINETWLKLEGELFLLQELEEAFKFRPPGFQFMPLYKNKVWDGWHRLVSAYKSRTFVGLAPQLKEFCESRGYKYEGFLPEKTDITPQEVAEYVDGLNLHSQNKSIKFRDYQYAAVFQSLKHKRIITESPTGSGKSAQIYTIIRYLVEQDKRVLLLVPTVSLVTQMKSDFEDYSSHNKWNIQENVHVIYSGQSKNTTKNVTISTWQSIQTRAKIQDSWYEQFDAIIVDETHLAKGKEISSILEKCINATYRLGFTGSLDKSQTHKQILFSHFNSSSKVATTRELIDQGHLSEISIKALVFKYPKDVSKILRDFDYKKEIDYIVRDAQRNKFIRNLALSTTGNTLVLFQYVEKHGAILNELMQKKAESMGKEVHYVYGGTDADTREEVRNLIKTKNNVIILASAGVFSTGINAPNIHNIIFTSPTKSMIKVIQSIGRGLRKADGKSHMKLFDLADDFRYGKHQNYTWKHFGERLKIYATEKFEYSIMEVKFV